METVLLYLLGILIILVGLAISIGLHEVGHLVPAKRFGVLVRQYMIGFGPTIFSFRRGETQYGLKAIPLGGYISMAGMYPPAKAGAARASTTGIFQTLVQDARDVSEQSMEGAAASRAFYNLPVWKRVIIMLGGPFMNLILAILIFGIILVGFGIPTLTTTIGSVSACVLPVGSEQTECAPGDPEAPGAAAGITPGDRIVSMNGEAIETWEQATAIIRDSPGKPIALVVDRAGANVELTATPVLSERYVIDENGRIAEDANGDPITQDVGFLGVGAVQQRVQQPVTAVLPYVGETLGRVAGVLVQLPVRVVELVGTLAGNGERDPEGLIGVVGIGRIAGEVASFDAPVIDRVTTMLGLVGGLNLALFAFNLIPLPPLDGGHVAAAVIDGIRRGIARLRGRPDPGPIDAAKIIPVTMVVAALLIGLTILLVIADIVKPVTLL